jgi:hypothetical protein
MFQLKSAHQSSESSAGAGQKKIGGPERYWIIGCPLFIVVDPPPNKGRRDATGPEGGVSKVAALRFLGSRGISWLLGVT